MAFYFEKGVGFPGKPCPPSLLFIVSDVHLRAGGYPGTKKAFLLLVTLSSVPQSYQGEGPI
jgi:hypothetical protein